MADKVRIRTFEDLTPSVTTPSFRERLEAFHFVWKSLTVVRIRVRVKGKG
jgi:hypothetical protein